MHSVIYCIYNDHDGGIFMKGCIKRAAAILLSLIVSFALTVTDTFAVSDTASAYILINADTLEVIAEKNADTHLPMASTTKLMTALILSERNDPEHEVTVTKEQVTVEGSSMGLLPGDRVTYYGLICGMMMNSGNDAANVTAYALAGSIEDFAVMMNERAAAIGMTDTHFVTPSGLDAEGHYSCARDMALLAAEVLKNEALANVVAKKSITVSFGNPPYKRTLYNHNKLLDGFDGCIGLKTGYTKKSGRCLVSAAECDGKRVIAVTLHDADDWNDHKELLSKGIKALTLYSPDDGSRCGMIKVVGGTSDTVPYIVEKCSFGVCEADGDDITCTVNVPKFLYAPVLDGDEIGFAEYRISSHTVKRVPVYAAGISDYKTVKFQKRGIRSVILRILKYIFRSV